MTSKWFKYQYHCQEEELKKKKKIEEKQRKREERRKKKSKHKYKELPTEKVYYSNDIFKEFEITNRISWLKWLVKNHPDKGGNTEMAQIVINLGREQKW